MENRYWRWIGILLICMTAFGVGYSYGFVNGGKQTFDFFMGFVSYSVENGILKMEINETQFEKYILLAKEYCFRNSQGSHSAQIDCGGN